MALARASAKTPRNEDARPGLESLYEIQIECIPKIADVWFVAVRAVVIELKLNILALAEGSRPAPHDVSARKDGGAVDYLLVGRRVIDEVAVVAGPLVVNIALQREGIAGIRSPIGAEAALNGAARVVVICVRMVF